MKLTTILALFTLVVIVKGTFMFVVQLAAASMPVILTIGSALTAVELGVLDKFSRSTIKRPKYKLSKNKKDDYVDNSKFVELTKEGLDKLMKKHEQFEK